VTEGARATLSLDLDDAWCYLRATGRPGWEDAPTVLPLVCERVLRLADELSLRITLFVVGRDLLDPAKERAIRPFVERGHEIGCHSFGHDPRFASLPPGELRREVVAAADLIEQRLGVRPRGFRAPGYAFTPELTGILRDAGFRYDASVLPTFLGPLCRAYYFFRTGMNREERQRRAAMYGKLSDGFAPMAPRMLPGAPPLASIPVTTFPVLRLPFHMSYVTWLAGMSGPLALAYVRTGLSLCRWLSLPPSYLLHSLDFVGAGEHSGIGFFPGMNDSWARKEGLLRSVLASLGSRFHVMPIGEFVAGGVGGR
jgi:peptidoglycan/xylan/chitin deacetylase (PgdA/CDA1 family)